MSVIHFLNVKDGDCSIIQHPSGRTTVIDVCNASVPEPVSEALYAAFAKLEKGSGGNHQQKRYPVNPISYLQDHKVSEIFRFMLTHPDMDHMDGIKALFQAFPPTNFWDTDNQKEMGAASWQGSPYKSEDWQFYKNIRDNGPTSNPKRLALLSRDTGPFYNQSYTSTQLIDPFKRNAEVSHGYTSAVGLPEEYGDRIWILGPTEDLVDEANRTQDYNDCSYVILVVTSQHRVVFGGDSHDKTWDYILETYREAIGDIDLLIAPHHGRSSGRSYKFLDVLKPKLTLFGNARSEHLAYSAWNYRNLPYITNNQAGCIIADDNAGTMNIYVTHENFARTRNPYTWWNSGLNAWYLQQV